MNVLGRRELLLGTLLVCVQASLVGAISVCPQDATPVCSDSCTIEVPVLVDGNLSLRAIGFDFGYEPTQLHYIGWLRGPLIRNWYYVGAQAHPESSEVRVGGFDATGTEASGIDTLAVLRFSVVCGTGTTRYTTRDFVDDLAGALPCDASAPLCSAIESVPWCVVKQRFR